MLPNPTNRWWDKIHFELPSLFKHLRDRRDQDVPHKSPDILLTPLAKLTQNELLYIGGDTDTRLTSALYSILAKCDAFLSSRSGCSAMNVAAAHFTKLIKDLNDPESRWGNLVTDSDHGEDCVMDIYFQDILPHIIRSDPRYTVADTSSDLRAASSASGAASLGSPSYELIWSWLLLRMIWWLEIHDFHRDDLMLPRSEYINSRLPVYIMWVSRRNSNPQCHVTPQCRFVYLFLPNTLLYLHYISMLNFDFLLVFALRLNRISAFLATHILYIWESQIQLCQVLDSVRSSQCEIIAVNPVWGVGRVP